MRKRDRYLSDDIKAKLSREANPQCPRCHGDGWIYVCYNNNPYDDYEYACGCTQEDRSEA